MFMENPAVMWQIFPHLRSYYAKSSVVDISARLTRSVYRVAQKRSIIIKSY